MRDEYRILVEKTRKNTWKAGMEMEDTIKLTLRDIRNEMGSN
jgi:hypothetical protein